MLYSTDGGTWSSPSSALSGSEGFQVAYGNGKWMVTAAAGKISTSTNGTSWSLVTNSLSGNTNVQMIVYNSMHDYWLAGGQDTSTGKAMLAYSTDGAAWNANLFNITDFYVGYSGPLCNTVYYPNEGIVSFSIVVNTQTPYAFYFGPRPTDFTNGPYPMTAVDTPNDSLNGYPGSAAFDSATYRAIFPRSSGTTALVVHTLCGIGIKLFGSFTD